MGRALLRLAAADARFDLVAAVSQSGSAIEGSSVPVFQATDLARCPPFDVAIDFSLAPGFDAVLAACLERKAALVSGTTGLDDWQRSQLSAAGSRIPVLWASNFSLGVVVLEDLVRRASLALREWPVAITETHHVHKKDAPSGTAITLARAASHGQDATPAIHSVREGEVVGEHVVSFSGPGETLELTHRATDRDVFSRGALEAALRLHGCSAGFWSLSALVLPWQAGLD